MKTPSERKKQLDEYNKTLDEFKIRYREIEKEKREILKQIKVIKNDINEGDIYATNVGATVNIKCMDLIEEIEMDPFTN